MVAPVDRSGRLPPRRSGRGVGLPAPARSTVGSRPGSTSGWSCPRTRTRPIPAAVVRAVGQPRASGAYAASLSLTACPSASYVLEAVVDGRVASPDLARRRDHPQAGLSAVGRTRPSRRASPARPSATTIDGEVLRRPAGAVDARSPSATDERRRRRPHRPATTGGSRPTGSRRSRTSVEGSEWRTLSAIPARPEEGEINADATVLVFPSAVTLAADGSITGKRLVVTGSLHEVDFARLERELAVRAANYPDVDPNGRPVAGARVTRDGHRAHPGPPPRRLRLRLDREAGRPALRVRHPTRSRSGRWRRRRRPTGPSGCRSGCPTPTTTTRSS